MNILRIVLQEITKTNKKFKRVVHERIAFLCFSIAEGVKETYDYRDPAYDFEDDDDSDNDGNKCPTVDLPPGLGGRCDVSDFCSKITCHASVQEKRATIIFQVNRCEDPLTATVTIKSPGFAVDWSHTFKDGDVIKLPADHGITEGLSPLAKVSISLKVGLKKEGKKLHFKVSFPPSVSDQSQPLNFSLHNNNLCRVFNPVYQRCTVKGPLSRYFSIPSKN